MANPYHLPGGSPRGGEFTHGPVGAAKAAMETNTTRGDKVETDEHRAAARAQVEPNAGNLHAKVVGVVSRDEYARIMRKGRTRITTRRSPSLN